MNIIEYLDKGGIIVYVLIVLNVIGFTIILWKFFTLPRKNAMIKKIENNLDLNSKNILTHIEYEVKKLELGLTYIKNIATIAPLLGLLGTVIGVYKSFEVISVQGLGNPSVFSNGIAIALITTITGLIVAIPHHLAYNHFIAIIDEIELKAKKVLLDR